MLHVFHIDAGRMLTYDIGYAAETVATLQDALAQTVHAPATEQILLISGGEVLDNPERRVSRYSAGTDSNPIFLVCRPTGELMGQSNYGGSTSSPTPDLLNTGEMENQLQQLAQSQPSLQTIQLCVQQARRLVQSADANVERCSQLVDDQHLLHQGWMAVIANLDDTVKAFRERLARFRDKIERFSAQRQRAVDLLASFKTDADLLKQIPLLPCLLPVGEMLSQSSAAANMTLFDWISSTEPEHSLHDLAAEAKQALDRLLDPKILENLTTFEGATLDRAQETSMKEIGGLGKRLARLNEYLQHVKKLQIEQRQYADSLRAQEQRAVSVNDSSIVADLCSSHLSALRKMIANQKQLADVTRRFYEAKTELLKNIHIRLRWVTDTHQLIQTGDSKVMMNGERLHRLRRQLELLKQLHDAPFVYASAVVEVVRRKSLSKEFADWADRLTDKSKQLYTDENRLRDIFSEKFDRHFLRTLFPGMEDRTPEFAQEAPRLFDTFLPAIEVDHVRQLRNSVPQLQHLLVVQKPNVYERVSSGPPWYDDKTRQQSASSLRREASFFSQTPPKYAIGATNMPVSGSAPVIIHNRYGGCQSPSWFAGDEMEFSPSETGKGGFLASVPSATDIVKKSDDGDEGGRRATIVSDSDSEPLPTNQDENELPLTGNGGSVRSAPIRIPTSYRNNDSIAAASTAMMTASRGQFSEKGSSSKFGTPDENLSGVLLEDDDEDRKPSLPKKSPALATITSVSSVHLSTKDDTLSRELAEKAAQLTTALETEQTLRRHLNEREAELENYRTLLSAKVIPELVEFRRFFEEVKRTFEELTSSNNKSQGEWAEIIDRAARKLESNLQTDLEEARKAEDELRKSEMNTAMEGLRQELEEERKRSREYQKQFENSEAYLKQKDDVIELLQQRLQEQEAASANQLDEARADLMKRLLIEQELAADTVRAQYERELESKDSELQQMKKDLAEKQQVLMEMRREQDRLMASMYEREVGCDFVTASMSNDQPQQQQPSQSRGDDFDEKLRQVKAELEREYKDKLQMLTAGLEEKLGQQLERARKEKEIEVRMLKLQLEQNIRGGDKSAQDGAMDASETTSANLEAWRSTENVADVILNSLQGDSATTSAFFQQGFEPECAEDEQEEEDGDQSQAQKETTESDSSKVVSPEDGATSKELVASKNKAVQTRSEGTKISVLRISKGDLVLLVFDPQFKSFVVFSVSPTLYILKDSCLQRMGCLQKNATSPSTPADSSKAAEPKPRWILGRVIELDYCQIKKPTNRYRLPMNTRFFRVATEPVAFKTPSFE